MQLAALGLGTGSVHALSEQLAPDVHPQNSFDEFLTKLQAEIDPPPYVLQAPAATQVVPINLHVAK